MKTEENGNTGDGAEQPLNSIRGRAPSDWDRLQDVLTKRFGEKMDFDAILFLIGLQELGKPFKKYKKDQKLEVMHVAICTLLEPFGFYEFVGRDPDGWPHWELKETIPHLDAKQQNKLIIDAIIDYFKKEELI
jgi:hypothetical protein